MQASDFQELLERLRAKRAFKVEDWIEKKCEMFNDYMRKCGLKACVVSVSGGVDSTCTLALVLHAQKQQNSPIQKILGIAQPIHSTASIQNRAFEAATALGAEIITVDQSDLHTQLVSKVKAALNNNSDTGFADGQLRSYMRTPVNYYVAQLLSSSGLPCIVMGTGNQDEDGYLFYFCKAGDGVTDIQLIADLHKSEVFTVSRYLGVPNTVLAAAPSADLWDGQTDEEELGFGYDFVELYTEWLQLEEGEQKELLSFLSPGSLQYFQEKKCGDTKNT